VSYKCPILQTKKLKDRKVKALNQGHRNNEQRQESWESEATLIPTAYTHPYQCRAWGGAGGTTTTGLMWLKDSKKRGRSRY
jgi:hypothetical protein